MLEELLGEEKQVTGEKNWELDREREKAKKEWRKGVRYKGKNGETEKMKLKERKRKGYAELQWKQEQNDFEKVIKEKEDTFKKHTRGRRQRRRWKKAEK